MNKFDILIAQKVKSFDLSNILSGGTRAFSYAHGDSFTYIKEGEQTPKYILGTFIWSVANMTENQMTLSTQAAAKCVLSTGDYKQQYTVKKCDIKLTLYLDELLNEANTNDNWFEFYASIDVSEINPLTMREIEQAMAAFIKKRKANIKKLFFKQEVCTDFKLYKNVTDSTFFIHQADKGLKQAYFCTGQMIDGRAKPDKPDFPTEMSQDLPPFLFHLSPYAYLSIGIKSHLHEQHPDKTIIFDEPNNKLSIYNIPCTDVGSFASELGLKQEDIASVNITEMSFSLTASGLKTYYEMTVSVDSNSKYGYHIKKTSTRYYSIDIANGQLQLNEVASLREEPDAVITYDHPKAEKVKEAFIKWTHIVLNFTIRILLPIAIDVMAGLNPVAGCALFALFGTIANFLEDAYQQHQERAQMKEQRMLNNLQISLKNLLPFQTKELYVKKSSISDGLIIAGDSGMVTQAPFLVKGQWLSLGQRLLITQICEGYMPENISLVLSYSDFRITQNTIEMDCTESTLWTSNWYWTTAMRYGMICDKIILNELGSLVLLDTQGRAIRQFKTGNTDVNMLFLSPQDRPAGTLMFCLAQVSDTDMNSLLSNDVNYYLEHKDEIFGRSKIYYLSEPNGRTLRQGQTLSCGEGLFADNYMLILDAEGDLVLYQSQERFPDTKQERWRYSKMYPSSFTKGAKYLKVNSTGELLAYSDDDQIHWRIYSGNLNFNTFYIVYARFGFGTTDEHEMYGTAQDSRIASIIEGKKHLVIYDNKPD